MARFQSRVSGIERREIDAFQMTAQAFADKDWPDWFANCMESGAIREVNIRNRRSLRIAKSGRLIVPFDWVVKNAVGDIYPCKPHIFAEFFEAA